MRTVALVSLLMLVAITHTRKSYNESVATVDANGLVTAVGSGTATISATASGGR